MGVFDTVTVEQGVDWPDECPIEPDEPAWQSKQIGAPSSKRYKITSDGRLLRKEYTYREKTGEEKQTEAEKWGFASWDSYVECYEESDGLTVPEAVDWDREADGYEDFPPATLPREETVDEVWWADHNMHGSFEFHHSAGSGEPYYSLEARFTKGELDEIVLLNIKEYDND